MVPFPAGARLATLAGAQRLWGCAWGGRGSSRRAAPGSAEPAGSRGSNPNNIP
jgi:hypothetical protein